jgi:hypothetical protein
MIKQNQLVITNWQQMPNKSGVNMNELNGETKISINPEINFTRIDDQLILMAPNEQGYYQVNTIGAKIWEMMSATPISLKDLADNLQRLYKLKEEQAMHDIIAFIEKMVTKKIVRINRP